MHFRCWKLAPGGTSGGQEAPGSPPTHTPLPPSVSSRKPIARPVLNSTAKWPGFTGRGARARSDPLPGSQEALQKRGEFLRGVAEGPLRPGLSGRQCPRHRQTRALGRGGGRSAETETGWSQPPPRAGSAWHLLIFATPPGAQHTQALALVGQRCSPLMIPARSCKFSGEGTLPPFSASCAGIAGPAPTEEAAEALSLPGSVAGNRARDWRHSECERVRG